MPYSTAPQGHQNTVVHEFHTPLLYEYHHSKCNVAGKALTPGLRNLERFEKLLTPSVIFGSTPRTLWMRRRQRSLFGLRTTKTALSTHYCQLIPPCSFLCLNTIDQDVCGDLSRLPLCFALSSQTSRCSVTHVLQPPCYGVQYSAARPSDANKEGQDTSQRCTQEYTEGRITCVLWCKECLAISHYRA